MIQNPLSFHMLISGDESPFPIYPSLRSVMNFNKDRVSVGVALPAPFPDRIGPRDRNTEQEIGRVL